MQNMWITWSIIKLKISLILMNNSKIIDDNFKNLLVHHKNGVYKNKYFGHYLHKNLFENIQNKIC